MLFKRIKKGDATFIFVSIFIAIISFFVMFAFFISLGDEVVDKSQDNTCRAFVGVKSSTAFKSVEDGAKIGDLNVFLETLNKKCLVDKIRVEKKDDVFKDVAEEMARCWYRYGEGEEDFMSNFGTSGNWCFLCGTVEFGDDLQGEEPKKYGDFVKWLEKNNCEGIGGCNKSQTYYNYMNLMYYEVENEELEDIGVEISELLLENGNDPAYKEVAAILLGQYEVLQDLKLKEINMDEKGYVVYRFNRVDESVTERLNDASLGALGSIGAGVSVAILGETLLWGGLATVSCALTPVTVGGTGPLCAILGYKTFVSGKKAVVNSWKGASKIVKLMERLSKLKSFSKGDKILSRFTGSVDELPGIAKRLEKTDPDLSEKVLTIHNDMRKLGIDNVDNIDELVSNKNLALEDVERLVSQSTNNVVLEIARKERKVELEGQISKMHDLKSELDDMVTSGSSKTDSQTFFQKAKEYVGTTLVVSSGIAGGAVGFAYNENSNQYVDVMTQEQYYRLCGTQRFED